MDAESCNCANCSSPEKRKSTKRNASIRQNSPPTSDDRPKILKTMEYRHNLSLLPQRTLPDATTANTAKIAATPRSRRCLHKETPKKSMSCEDFMARFGEILRSKSNENAYQISHRVISLVQIAFPLDINILGESFLELGAKDCSRLRLDLKGVREMFRRVRGLGFKDVNSSLAERMRLIIKCLVSTAKKGQTKNSIKVRRIIVLILESPVIGMPPAERHYNSNILGHFFLFVSSLKSSSQLALSKLFSTYSADPFSKLLASVQQNALSSCLQNESNGTLNAVLQMLAILYSANKWAQIVPNAEFQNESVVEIILLRHRSDYSGINRVETLINHPWLISIETKQMLLKAECSKEQFRARFAERDFTPETPPLSPGRNPTVSFTRAPLRPISSSQASPHRAPGPEIFRFDGFSQIDPQIDDEFGAIEDALSGAENRRNPFGFAASDLGAARGSFEFDLDVVSQYCYFVVSRDNISADTFHFMENYDTNELKKKLKIVFKQENGVDEGGVKNEYFEVLTKNLLNSGYGLFVVNTESNCTWFSQNWTDESYQDYEFCGTMIAIALYNDVMVDLKFPGAFYKHLLGQKVGFEDLADFAPELQKGLRAMLEFKGDVEETFCRSFEVVSNIFGEDIVQELVPGGSSVPVTDVNRKEFVELYSEWILEKSVKRQINAFKVGFDRIFMSEKQWILKLFSPEDLKLCLCGTEKLDFKKWKAKATLTGFKQTDLIIRNFWKIVMSFDIESKRKLLFFVTGCVRAPINGLGSLPLRIIKGDSTEMLPTSRTCFNQLVLPPYESCAKLEEKLMLALENSEGFGLQ